MTSVLRSPSQIGVREKYLISLVDLSGSGTVVDDTCIAFALDVPQPLNAGVYTAASLPALYTGVYLAYGALYRDLGQEIVVIGADEKYLVRYRLAAPVSNVYAEGQQAPPANVWLRVWAASGAGVSVARMG